MPFVCKVYKQVLTHTHMRVGSCRTHDAFCFCLWSLILPAFQLYFHASALFLSLLYMFMSSFLLLWNPTLSQKDCQCRTETKFLSLTPCINWCNPCVTVKLQQWRGRSSPRSIDPLQRWDTDTVNHSRLMQYVTTVFSLSVVMWLDAWAAKLLMC